MGMGVIMAENGNMEELRECRHCGEEKEVSEFLGKIRGRKCFECERIKQRDRDARRYADDPDRIRALGRKWYADNPEKAKAKRDRWYSANREKAKAQQREKYADNPEKIKAACQKWRAKNKDNIRGYSRKYILSNKEKINKRKRDRRIEIPDGFAKEMLCRKNSLTPGDIPGELVGIYRASLKIKRLLKEKKDEATNK